jgi:hypothetical protein
MLFVIEVTVKRKIYRQFLVEAENVDQAGRQLMTLQQREADAGEPLFPNDVELFIESLQFENEEKVYDLGLT